MTARLARVVLLGGVLYAALAQGAFYRHQAIVFWPVVFVSALLAVSGFVVGSRRWPCREAAWAIPVLASTAISGAIAGSLDATVPMLMTIVAVFSALFVGHLASEIGRRRLVAGLIGVGLLVATTAVIGSVQRYEPWGRLVNGLWRGSSSLTYSNAAAGLIVAMLLVTISRLASGRRHRLDFVAAHVLVVGAVATLSRGGAVGLVFGLGVLLLTIGPTVLARVSAPVLAGSVVSGASVLSMASEEVTRSPLLAWAGMALGLCITVVGAERQHATRVTAFAFSVMFVVLVGVVTIDAVGESGTSLTDRLTLSDELRAGEWRAAWSEFESQPLVGVGPGRATFRFVVGDETFTAEFAHQEYLELAAEQGLMGLVAVLTPITVAIAVLVRRWRRNLDPLIAGCLAAFIGFLAHSGLDFLWHIPLLPVVVATLVGTALWEPGSES
ncbi:MAG: hypothetical protein GXP35_10940 [Actinobacteria bacterium]|nr:hypothetical protein [Actinomycetota bacterium]